MVEQPSNRPPAGWHPDPTASGMLRYWDGSAWTEQVRQAAEQAQATQPGFAAAGSYQAQVAASPRPKAEAGFFRSIFDLSFSADRVVVITFARVIYLILSTLLVLSWLFTVVIIFLTATAAGLLFVVWGVLHLLFGWIGAFIGIVLVRVTLELVIAQIRTSQHTARLVQLAESS